MADFPFDDNIAGIRNGDDAELADVTLSKITFPDGSTQIQAAVPASQVTVLDYAGTTLTLEQSAGPDLTTTIPSGALPFAFAQTDDTEIINNLAYDNTPLPGAQITQLSQTITPTSSSQKVAIHMSLFGEWESNPYECAVLLERKIGATGTATVIQPDNAGSRMAIGSKWAVTISTNNNFISPELLNLVYVDSPSTTDTITYTPRVVAQPVLFPTNRNFYLNRSLNDGNSDAYQRAFSTMTLECKNV